MAVLVATLGFALAATPSYAGPHGGGGGGGHGGYGGHGGGGYHGGHGGYGHYGHGGYGHGPRVFIGGSFFVDPFFWPAYPYYYAPYPYASYGSYGGYPVAPPPDDDEWASGAPPSDDSDVRDDSDQRNAPPPAQSRREETPDEADRANYGLIQLRGVPDGAAIDLDGRFWLKAVNLEKRWLAVPHGSHRVTVYVANTEPAERRVDVSAGKNQVVKFGPFPRGNS